MTANTVIGEHVALTLEIGTSRPDIDSEQKKYNIRSMTDKDWEKKNAQICRDSRYTKLHGGPRQGAHTGNPGQIHREIMGIYRDNFADLLAKAKSGENTNDAESSTRQNKGRGRAQEYKMLLKKGDFEKCGQIQKEISRDNWREFLGTSKIYDLRKVSQYFARMEGIGSMGGKSSRLDPMRGNGKTLFHPKEKAEALGRFSEEKKAAVRRGQKIPVSEIREAIGKLTPKGRIKVVPGINAREIKLAAKDIPRNRAARPDLLPAEMYIKCPAMHRGLAALFNEMLERN